MYSPQRWCTAIPVLSALVLMTHGATIKFDQSQTGDYNLQIHLKNIELYAVFDDSGGSDDEYEDLPDYTDPTDAPSKPPPSPTGATSTTVAPSPPSNSYNNSNNSNNSYNSNNSNNSNNNSNSSNNSNNSNNNSSSSSTAASYVLSSSTEAVASSAAALLDPYSPSNSDKIVQMVEALIASNGNTSDMPAEPPPPSAASQQQPSSTPPPQQLQQQQQQQLQESTPPAALALAAASANSTANRKCGPGYFRDPMGRCRRIRKPHLPFLQMVHTPGVIKSFQPQLRTTEDDRTSKN